MAEINPYLEDISQSLLFLDLSALANSNILITGATGLIGGCITDFLMHQQQVNCEVYALGRNEERAHNRFFHYWNDARFHFIKGDVTEPLTVSIKFDYIIHAASNASPNFFQQKPVEVMKANFKGVEQLMEYGLTHSMKRMLYVSSGEIYGEGSGSVFKETDSGYVDCATPRACYPSSKRAAETLCMSYASEYGADVVIGRPCHTYGPYFTESDNRVYAQFIRNLLADEDIIMKSAGLQYRSWLYVVDCAAALLTILLKGTCGEAYNVADETSNITIRQLAELLASTASKRVVMTADSPIQGTPITRAVFDTTKLRHLGWHPLTTIADGLSHTIATQKLLC